MKTVRMHGKVNFGCLTLIILSVAGGYVGFKFGTVYLAQYMFDKKVFLRLPVTRPKTGKRKSILQKET